MGWVYLLLFIIIGLQVWNLLVSKQGVKISMATEEEVKTAFQGVATQLDAVNTAVGAEGDAISGIGDDVAKVVTILQGSPTPDQMDQAVAALNQISGSLQQTGTNLAGHQDSLTKAKDALDAVINPAPPTT